MTTSNSVVHRSRSRLQWAALIVGVTFLVVGVLGFIPGITTNVDTMEFVGHDGNAKLLGLFEISVLQNIVHLLFGVAGLVMSRTSAASRSYLIGGGAIYLVLWLYGLLVDQNSDANFVPLNDADNWLHLGLGLGMILLGVVLSKDREVVAHR